MDSACESSDIFNLVDNKQVPVPHFGIILLWQDWHNLANKLKNANIKFFIEPYVRFKNLKGEQATLFFKDPNGLNLEFKSFKNDQMIFDRGEPNTKS